MNSWLDELSASITDISELKKHLTLTEEELQAFSSPEAAHFKITPHILNIIKNNDEDNRIRKQFIPSKNDIPTVPDFSEDFLCESTHEVCDNLVVRYPYKAILLVTKKCPAYCQFCTRKRMVSDHSKVSDLNAAFLFLADHPEIYDIVITGGDPLILNDDELEYIFHRLRDIKSIKFIRLNTRIPVTLPTRINDNLIQLLAKYGINYISIHFEHPNEITEETTAACLKLANSGILLSSQTVLLNRINDDSDTLKKLFLSLLSIKVRPYYLYQCDKVNGCQSFYVSPNKGIMLVNSIVDELPGLSIPRFVIDAPNEMGKITVAPNGLVEIFDDNLLLKNYYNNKKYLYDL